MHRLPSRTSLRPLASAICVLVAVGALSLGAERVYSSCSATECYEFTTNWINGVSPPCIDYEYTTAAIGYSSTGNGSSYSTNGNVQRRNCTGCTPECSTANQSRATNPTGCGAFSGPYLRFKCDGT